MARQRAVGHEGVLERVHGVMGSCYANLEEAKIEGKRKNGPPRTRIRPQRQNLLRTAPFFFFWGGGEGGQTGLN